MKSYQTINVSISSQSQELTIDDRISLAARWLSSSAIRNSNPVSYGYGGINSGYNFRQKEYDYIYSEITGYAINAFLNLLKWSGEEKYLEMACQAADYLLGLQQQLSGTENYGAIPHCANIETANSCQEYYAFDIAMCITGLVDLYQTTRQTKYLEAGRQATDWLISHMQNPDGSFNSAISINTGKTYPLNLGTSWYGDRGCLYAKNGIGLPKLNHITDIVNYAEHPEGVLDWVMELQNSDGSFPVKRDHTLIFTHAHCYATEGYEKKF